MIAVIEPDAGGPDEQHRLRTKLFGEADALRADGRPSFIAHLKRHGLEEPAASLAPEQRAAVTVFSTNLAHDVLAIRRIARDRHAKELSILCPAAYEDDLRFMVSRAFLGDLVPTLVPIDCRPAKIGPDKYDQWVDVPFNSVDDGTGFPAAIYENAAAEHKHYDNVSLAVVSGQILIAGSALLKIESSTGIWFQGLVALAGVAGIWASWWLYDRTSHWARLARRVMMAIEISHGQPGFALNVANSRLRRRSTCARRLRF
jgi:hypothetical protein